MDRIPYTKPSITKLEIDYCNDAVTYGWGEKCYDYVYKFEYEFAKYLGAKHALSTSSCTGAMTMGLEAMGVGFGDEVIMADTNWIATVAPVVYCGATPVFVDIDPVSWCIDPSAIKSKISTKTKAIIATHLYGNLCDMKTLDEISVKYGIPIIEDAAEAIGSKYCMKNAGSMGLFGTFSFHGTKTLTTGEGGMFVTDDTELYNKVLTLSNHGRDKNQNKQFWADKIGFKFKMSNVQAAIGCAQVERIEELVARKREILKFYIDGLLDFKGLKLNPEGANEINGAWMPTVVFDSKLNITQTDLMVAFKKANIDARVFFWPLSKLPMFENNRENYNAWSIPKRSINLPSFHDITIEQQTCIIDVIYNLRKK